MQIEFFFRGARTNSAVVAKSRSFVPSDLTALPDVQIQWAQQAEPSLVFRCSTPNSLARQSIHLAAIASLERGCEPVRFQISRIIFEGCPIERQLY